MKTQFHGVSLVSELASSIRFSVARESRLPMSINKTTKVSGPPNADGSVSNGASTPKTRQRGLPDRSSLQSLAETYIHVQQQHWPKEIARIYPDVSRKSDLGRMIELFERTYISGEPSTEIAGPSEGGMLGVAYCRYSDANSNPRSLDQQLQNVLERAAKEAFFVPWQYVFADAAISGTTDKRGGYQLMKSLIVRDADAPKCFFIDELGRASRDHIESLTLGRLIEQCGKRLIGATDGFDSENPTSKIMLTIFSMLHELFVDQLREKVGRGLDDSFRQGKPLYKPSYGYALEPILDDDGVPIVSQGGKPIQQVVIVPTEAEQVRRIFKLYADDGWSPRRIAQLFNEEQIDDRQSWSNSLIRNALQREMYRGREIWRRTAKKMDPQTKVIRTVNRPEEEWRVREMPHLRIIDEDLWRRAQDRMEELSVAYNAADSSISRNEGHAKRIFNYFCHGCGKPMWSGRGSSRPVVCCPRGRDGIDGCNMDGSKTVSHIDQSLLNFILGKLVDGQFVTNLVDAANNYLTDLPRAPSPDKKVIEREIKSKSKSIDRIVSSLEAFDEEADLVPVLQKVAKLRKEVSELKSQLTAAEQSHAKVDPIRHDQAAELVADLSELLYRDTEASNRVLSALVGRVKIERGEKISQRRFKWYAHFEFNSVPVLLEIARQKSCPSTDTWEFLSDRSWTTEVPTTLEIRRFTNAEILSKTVARMHAAGSSRNNIAISLAIDSTTVDTALRLWGDGERCYLPDQRLVESRRFESIESVKLQQEVRRLVDEVGLDFKEVGEKLERSSALVARAYKQADPTKNRLLAMDGAILRKSAKRRISQEQINLIRLRVTESKMSNRKIAQEVGCDHHTVADEKQRMAREGIDF